MEINGAFSFMGSVATKADLEKVKKEPGMIYQVRDENCPYVYVEENSFEPLVTSDCVDSNKNNIEWEEMD